MTDRNHPLPLARQAELAGIGRGTVYFLPKAVGTDDVGLVRRTAAHAKAA